MHKNWEDEFDFENDTAHHIAKKNNDKKKNKNTNNYQFQELSGEDRNAKLPTIGAKLNNTQKSTKNMNKVNLEDINYKSNHKNKMPQLEQLDEHFQQQLAPLTSPPKPNKHKENEQKPKANTYTLKEKQYEGKREEYGDQQFQEPDYGDDFEIHEQKKTSPVISKSKGQNEEPVKNTSNTISIPKRVKQNRRGAQSVMKNNQNSVRAYTRNSARSQDRSLNSRSKADEKKEEAPNKYTNIAEKNCPHFERKTLEEFNMDKLMRQNEKIRNTIKKFNVELNDMINRNILMLKGKKEEKVVDQQQVIKQLEEVKNSNQTALQNTIRDLFKLKGKEGVLKEEEYQLTLDQKLQQTKNTITEMGKIITKLNFQISNQGNKLSKRDKDIKQTNPNAEINVVKMNLFNIRKEDEKNEETYKKIELKLDELSKKMAEMQNKFNQQLQDAKAKGITISKNPQILKKLQELKKKVDTGRQHKGKTQALYKTKSDLVQRQLQQIKEQIKNVQSSTANCRNNCEDIQEQSRKTFEKAKKAGRVSQELVNSLYIILNQMERGIISSKDNNEEQATFSHPKGAKKYQSQKNVEKVVPASVTQREPDRVQDDSNIKKPQLFKKKKQEEQKFEERVWKDDKNPSPPKTQKVKESHTDLTKFQNKESERRDQEKKKPFLFKKNKDKTAEQEPKAQSPKPQVKETKKEEHKIEEPKKDQQINIAPRMMRFKRNKEEIAKQEIKIPTPIEKPVESAPISIKETTNIVPPKIQLKTETQQPVIVPKRFNLKLKDRKNEEAGYVATNMQKKEEIRIEQPKKSGLSLDNQKVTIKQSEKPPASKFETTQEKPYFNLKLKDRQKEANRQQPKVEQKIESRKQQQPFKIPIILNDNPHPMKENNNPYVQQQGVKRQREGPIRKLKPQQNAPKQQFSIFEQAGDIEI